MSKHSGYGSIIEYFADMTFGQRLSMARELAFRHWLSVLGGAIAGAVVIGLSLLLLWMVIAFIAGSMAGSLNYGDRETLFFIFAMLFYGVFFLMMVYLAIGIDVLALRFVTHKPAPIFNSLGAPLTVQPLGLMISLGLWTVILVVAGIPLALIKVNFAFDLAINWLFLIIFGVPFSLALFYLADCANRRRRFKIAETLSKPFSLFFNNLGIWLGTAVFNFCLLAPGMLPSFLYEMRILSKDSGMTILLLIAGSVYTLVISCLLFFLAAVTYQQSKARFILGRR